MIRPLLLYTVNAPFFSVSHVPFWGNAYQRRCLSLASVMTPHMHRLRNRFPCDFAVMQIETGCLDWLSERGAAWEFAEGDKKSAVLAVRLRDRQDRMEFAIRFPKCIVDFDKDDIRWPRH